MNVPVPEDLLNSLAAFADQARRVSVSVRSSVARSDGAEACEQLTDLHVAALTALEELHAAGALLPTAVPCD